MPPVRPDGESDADGRLPHRRDREPDDREKLSLLASVLDLLPDFCYVHDYDMRFWFANRHAASFFGRTKEDLIGRRLMDVDRDKEQARLFVEVCQRVMREGVPKLTDNLPYIRRDGTPGVLRQHDIPFRNPATGETMLLGISRDVTAEKQIDAERMRRAALERELDVARQIQRSLRPGKDRSAWPPGLSLAGYSEPAAYAGGDFYDWFALPDGRIAVVIGDVTGHGIGPALLAAECRAYARALLQREPLPGAMRRLDEMLSPDLPDGRFVTLAAATIDPGTFEVCLVSAGHGPLTVRRRNGSVEDAEVTLPPLGVWRDIGIDKDPEPARLDLAEGDGLVLLSDGVFEARGADGAQFGMDRVRAMLSGGGSNGEAMIEALTKELAGFAGESGVADDVTIVIVGREE